MSFEKINRFIEVCRAMQENEEDIFSLVSGIKGSGKTTFSIQAARRYVERFGFYCPKCDFEWMYTGKAVTFLKDGSFTVAKEFREPCLKCGKEDVERVKKFNFRRYLAYDNDEMYEMVLDLPLYSPILGDEAVRFMMGEDWNTNESKRMKKLVAQMRTKGLIFFGNMPRFSWTDSKYRDDMTTFWIRILKRGIVVILMPDLGEAEDPWHLKELNKILGSYFYFTPEKDIIERAEKIVNKHPCGFDWFRVPAVPRDIYEEYLKIRNAKAFDRKKLRDNVDQKDVAKVAVWNLFNKWPEIAGAIKSARFERPTLKMIEQFVFLNPETDEPLLAYTTIRNWLSEIDKIVRRKSPMEKEEEEA